MIMSDFLFGFICGIVFIYAIGYLLLVLRMRRIRKHMTVLKDDVEKRSRIVEVDIVGEQMFAYDKESKKFLCKFNNFFDLHEELTKQYPDAIWHMDANHYPAVVKHIEYLKGKNG
jgi:hypothetical protein